MAIRLRLRFPGTCPPRASHFLGGQRPSPSLALRETMLEDERHTEAECTESHSPLQCGLHSATAVARHAWRRRGRLVGPSILVATRSVCRSVNGSTHVLNLLLPSVTSTHLGNAPSMCQILSLISNRRKTFVTPSFKIRSQRQFLLRQLGRLKFCRSGVGQGSKNLGAPGFRRGLRESRQSLRKLPLHRRSPPLKGRNFSWQSILPLFVTSAPRERVPHGRGLQSTPVYP
jgi:hypothetical protein